MLNAERAKNEERQKFTLYGLCFATCCAALIYYGCCRRRVNIKADEVETKNGAGELKTMDISSQSEVNELPA